MDLQTLLYLVKSIENNNISQTAQELNVSQPAVSKGIKKLEESVEARLIVRHGKGIKPTKTGEVLYRHAKTILNQVNRATNEIESVKGKQRQNLTIGCSPSVVEGALPDIISLFSKQWPTCKLTLEKALYPELLTALKNDELDAVLALDFHSYNESDLEFDILGRSTIVFLVNPHHPLAKVETLSVEQMSAARWVILNVDETLKYFESLFLSKDIKPAEPYVLSGSMNIVKSTLMNTDLIGFLPKQMVAHELENGTLIQVNAQVPVREMDIVLAHNKTLFPSEMLKSFLKASKEVIIDS